MKGLINPENIHYPNIKRIHSAKTIFKDLERINKEKEFLINREEELEINSLLSNLQFSSNEGNTESTEEILSILNENNFNDGADIFLTNKQNSCPSFRPRKIKLQGKILLSDNNLISKIKNLNLKHIPERVSNPLFKTLEKEQNMT